MKTFLFARLTLPKSSVKELSIKSFSLIHGCLYITPTMVFGSFLLVISMNADSSSLDLYIWRSVLGLNEIPFLT